MARLGGRRASGNLPRGETDDQVHGMGFRTGTCGDQNACANTRQRRRNGHMAKRAGVGRRIAMVMPDRAERTRQQQHEECYRGYHTPDSLLVRHF